MTSGRRPSPVFPPIAAFRPVAWILVALGILKTSADPDLWGHVRFGLDILRDRALVSIDPYSFTQDVAWMNHEWLSEVVMGLAQRTAGPLGLAALKALLAAGTYFVVYATLRHSHVIGPRARGLRERRSRPGSASPTARLVIEAETDRRHRRSHQAASPSR